MIKSTWYLNSQVDLEQKKVEYGEVWKYGWWSFHGTFCTKPSSHETFCEKTILVRKLCYETLIVQNYYRFFRCIQVKILFRFGKKPFFLKCRWFAHWCNLFKTAENKTMIDDESECGNLRFRVSNRGEQKCTDECSLVMWCWMLRVSGNLRFEVIKRGEQKCGKECSFVMWCWMSRVNVATFDSESAKEVNRSVLRNVRLWCDVGWEEWVIIFDWKERGMAAM